MAAKRLFVIDCMAMAFRGFYALGGRPLTTATGQPTSAVFTSAMFLNKLINEEQPDYLLAATDTSAPTFRHEMYPEYKANRSEMPEDLAAQLPHYFKLFEALKIPVLREEGVEADDLIGSLAAQLGDQELEIYIVSGDKDFMQLVTDRVKLYTPKKGDTAVIVDTAGVDKKFGVRPDQVIDCLALIGDSSDNVPGVPGIGEKGAAKLIQSYGSLDGIYEHLEEITNKRQRTGLEGNKELAYLSQKLVTIKLDCDIDLNLEKYVCNGDEAMNNADTLELYQELEFNQLAGKVEKALAKRAEAPAPVAPANTADQQYTIATTKKQINEVLSKLASVDRYSFDTETTGLDIVTDRPIGLSVSWAEGEAAYIPFVDKHLDDLSGDDAMALVRPALAEDRAQKIAHNLKYDLQILMNVDVPVQGPFGDTMIADYLLHPISRQHGLDYCCLEHLGYRKIPTKELIGDKGEISMLDVPLDKLGHYACEDADYTLRLAEFFAPMLREQELEHVYGDIEMPLVPALAHMERTGVYINADELADFSEELGVMVAELQTTIYEAAGEEFNINSPKQLQEILFNKLKVHEELGVKRLKKTKTGFSTDESVLTKLSAHPLPAALLKYRMVAKLKNTYVDTLPQLIHPQTNRIHASFHQTGTATGRLSSSDPNLQNIPIRTELGQRIRRAFTAQDSSWEMISADYSQVELRLLAHLAQDDGLKSAFANDQDIHTATAAKVFGVAEADVDATMRSRAKAINFGIIYGMGPRRLAAETGVSMKEASEFIEKYFAGYPKIKDFIANAIGDARDRGYSRTISGRRRPIPGLNDGGDRERVNAENIAVNSPIQGSAADLIKLAMIQVEKNFQNAGLKAKMLMQVHDELVFTCPQDEVDQVAKMVRDAMESALDIDVPLKVELGRGANWLEAH